MQSFMGLAQFQKLNLAYGSNSYNVIAFYRIWQFTVKNVLSLISKS